MEFSEDEWKLIARRAKKCDLVFLSSAFSNKAVDLLLNCGMQA